MKDEFMKKRKVTVGMEVLFVRVKAVNANRMKKAAKKKGVTYSAYIDALLSKVKSGSQSIRA